MALDGKQLKQIRDALLDGYDESGLHDMVLFELNEDIDRIAGGKDLEERVLNLVKWARRTGRLDQLVQAAYAQNPNNKKIKDLHDAWIPPQDVSETDQPTAGAGGVDPDGKGDEQPGPAKEAVQVSGRGVSRWLAVIVVLIVVGLVAWYFAAIDGPKPAAETPAGAVDEPAATATETRTIIPGASPATGVGNEAPEPGDAPAAVWVNSVDQAEYVLIPAGAFVMGSDLTVDGMAREYQDRELPQRVLSLDDFWMMRTEVTNGQYGQCVTAGACSAPDNDEWKVPAFANRPVTGVSWEQANDYAEWVGGRLPTEAEWEKACRGTEGSIYPWGDGMPSAQRLNYNSNVGRTEDVASYPPGKYGLYDMAGNVWEWTSSQYAAYPYDAEDGREDPAAVTDPVTRGSAFGASPAAARCAFRNSEVGGKPDPFVGFRVVSGGAEGVAR